MFTISNMFTTSIILIIIGISLILFLIKLSEKKHKPILGDFGMLLALLCISTAIILMTLDLGIGSSNIEAYEVNVYPAYNLKYTVSSGRIRGGVYILYNFDINDKQLRENSYLREIAVIKEEFEPFCVERKYRVLGIFDKSTYQLYINEEDLKELSDSYLENLYSFEE